MTAAITDPGPRSDGVPAPLADHPRYKVLGRLGSGGMGVVYKAEHKVMGRTVALKVLNPAAVARPGAVERFRREVRLASRLSHPNIVTAHDADEAGGLHFLVMEYVDGVSLDKLVARKGPLPVAVACHYARQAALGLQHACEKGMVHRDIKPHNLMVTRQGQVKILDFGLARVALAEAGGEAESPTAVQMTADDLVLGTPDFLAPEQARNSTRVDVRADLYSLGCTLYYLLTGRPPFGGTTGVEKLVAHSQDPPPDATAARPAVPAALSAVIRKLMAKDPAARFQTPAEVAAALAPFTRPAPPPARVAARVRVAEPVARAAPGPAAEMPADGRPSGQTAPAPRLALARRAVPVPPPQPASRRPVLIAGAVVIAVLLLAGVVGVWIARGSRPPADGAAPPAAGSPRADRAYALPPPVAGRPEVLIVLPTRGVHDPDYGPVREALERGGAAVRTAAPTRGPCPRLPDTSGPPVTPDVALAEVDPDRFAAVVLVGSGVEDYLPGGPAEADARRVIDGARERNRTVAAIGAGVRVLGELGYLDGRPAALAAYRNPLVRWRKGEVVKAPPYITAGSDRAAAAFAKAILEAVGK